MKNLFINTYKILNLKQKLRLVFIGFATIITGLLEMLTIALFIPLIGLIVDDSYLSRFYYLAELINKISQKIDLDKFFILIILLAIVFLIKNIIILFLNFYSSKSAYLTRNEIGNKIMKNYLNADYEFYFQKNSSVIFYFLTEEIARLGHMLLAIIRLITNIIITIFIFSFIFYSYPSQLLLLVLSTLIGAGLYYLFTKNFVANFGKERVIKENQYQKNLRETLDFVKEIKIYFKENFFKENFYKNNEIINRYGYIWSFFQTLPKVWFELVAVFSLFLVLVFNYTKSFNNNEIIISLSIMVYAIARILPSVNIIISSLQSLKFSQYGFEQIKEYITLENNKNFINQTYSERFDSLELKDISFGYNNDFLIIKNLNFKVKKGETIGIIGESGVGKSTLVNVITGLLNIKDGFYYLNNKQVQNIRFKKQNLFGYIPQNINLLDDTIVKNITLNNEKIDNKRFEDILDKAGLKKFILSLKMRENNFIGEKGTNLSGGQAQRIALARALYHNPDIFILDEATNALNEELEKEILEALKSLGKTLIIISHNKNSLSICDKIYKLEDKRLNQI